MGWMDLRILQMQVVLDIHDLNPEHGPHFWPVLGKLCKFCPKLHRQNENYVMVLLWQRHAPGHTIWETRRNKKCTWRDSNPCPLHLEEECSSTHRDLRVSTKISIALPMHRTLINAANFRLCTTGSSSPSTRSPTRWTCRCRWTCRSRATSTARAPSRPLSAPKSLPMRSRNCGNFQSNFTSRRQNTEAAFINPFTKQPWVRFSAFPRIL